MAITGSGSAYSIASGLSEANAVLTVALALSALLTFMVSIAQLARGAGHLSPPQMAIWGTAVLLGCIPALLLWSAESFTIAMISGKDTGSIAEASQRLATLLTAAMLIGVLVPVVGVVAAITFHLVSGSADSAAKSRTQAVLWFIAALTFAGLAVSYYVRTAGLAAMRGGM